MKRLIIRLHLAALVFVSLFTTSVLVAPPALAAACTAPATDYGMVTSTVSVQTAGTYHIWSRMAAPNSGSNSYKLEVTSGGTTNCYTVTGNASGLYSGTPATHFQSGSQNWTKTAGGSPISMSLAAGTTTVKMIGTAADVYLDRVVMTTDTTCTPTGTGENCATPPDNTPPTVSIASPANGASVSTSPTVTVNATDSDGVVSKVELWRDNPTMSGAASYTDLVSPFSFSVTGLTPGTHTFIARATNAAGLTSVSTLVTVTVSDTTAPTVSITSPSNSSAQSGTITVTANASDAVGVSRVDFYAGTTKFGEATGAPYSATLDTTTLSNASHNLTARAFDAAGNQTTSSTVAITVNNSTGGTDTTSPTVVIPTTLSTGSPKIAGKTYQFTGITVSDASGISRVEVLVDGIVRTTRTTSPFTLTLDTSTLATGTRNIVIRVTDNATARNVTTAATFPVRITALHDVNRDCRVNIGDLSYISSRYTSSAATDATANVNGDTRINIGDISYTASRYTYSAPTGSQLPNPCTP